MRRCVCLALTHDHALAIFQRTGTRTPYAVNDLVSAEIVAMSATRSLQKFARPAAVVDQAPSLPAERLYSIDNRVDRLTTGGRMQKG